MASTTAPVDIGTLIYSRPDLHDGRPCLAGTGMTVHAVAIRWLRGQSPDEIWDDIPDIPLSHFYAAVAYYLANREQIDADIAADAKLYDELAARYPHGWGPNTAPVQ